MSHSLSRRDFLKAGAVLTAAGLIPGGTLLAEEPAKKRKLKKAIMYATITYKGSVLEKFQAVKAAGFEGVEPMSHMNQEEVLKAFEETGLKPASVCCSTHWNKPLSSPDEAVRKDGLEGLLYSLKDAKRYGASSVLLVPGRIVVNDKEPAKAVNYDECFQRSVAEIRKAIPTAEKLGVKIAIENVWNDFITKPEQAKAYLDEINNPMVGWHFDIGNCLRYGPAENWVPILGKRIVKLHIKEYKHIDKNFKVKFFEGDNHWPAIMKALDEVGYDSWGISEQPGDQSKDAAALKDLSERMDKVFSS